MKALKFILKGLMLSVLFSFIGQKPQQTLENLQKAYQAEANAVKKYELYAKKADKEGYTEVGELFRAIAKSESIHMENHKLAIEELGGKIPKIKYEKVKAGTTRENLEGPIQEERMETDEMYPHYIEIAQQENAEVAVKSFRYAMNTEAQHEQLFSHALSHLGEDRPVDYYVSSVSGETIEVFETASAPQPELKGEEYLKIN